MAIVRFASNLDFHKLHYLHYHHTITPYYHKVALYYREEGVLFLLLNHFLKISNGNVSRCYDETSEAIATSNGYSHLMDFFQYYDNINLYSPLPIQVLWF